MQGIYTYVPGTNHVPREHHVVAILVLLFLVLISLFPALTQLYLYVCTFRSMCAVPNMAVFFFFFNLLIGRQLSIWICCKLFFSLLYNCPLLCSWRLALSIVVEVFPWHFFLAIGKPRLQYLQQVARNIGADSYAGCST